MASAACAGRHDGRVGGRWGAASRGVPSPRVRGKLELELDVTAYLVALVLVAAPPFVAVERFAEDAKALVPQRQEAPALLVALASTLAASQVDRHASASFARHAPAALSRFEPLGRYQVGNLAGAGLLAWGLATHESRWASAGVSFLEANLLSSALVAGLQRALGRSRPGSPHEGEFGRGGSSFPSSHAAHAFAAAGVAYATCSTWKLRWVFPALASGVALSRVADRQHFLADVGFSAVLGWWVGTRLGASGQRYGRWEVAVGEGTVALRLTLP